MILSSRPATTLYSFSIAIKCKYVSFSVPYLFIYLRIEIWFCNVKIRVNRHIHIQIRMIHWKAPRGHDGISVAGVLSIDG